MNHGAANNNAAPATNANAPAANNQAAANTNSGHSSHGGHMNHGDMKSAPGAANAPYDLQFLDTMIAHHEGAVEMAKMAETRALKPELKTFAAKILADQTREINQMKQWRQQWFAGQPSALNMEMPGMAESMRMDMMRLNSLTGSDFDMVFLQMMVPHHEGAVKMAEDALVNAKQNEIKKLSQEILKSQTDEINQMQTWEVQWQK